MKATLFLVVVAIIAVAAAAVVVEPLEESLARDVHAAWKRIHQKVYATELEEEHRFQVFRTNLQKIRQHNAENHGWTMKMNRFGDLEFHEFKALHHGVHKRGARSEFTIGTHQALKDAPTSIDWRQKGYVTTVKDQGQCGSCWSFSTTGSLEGAYYHKNNQLVSLSEQELVDCSGPEGNQGCNGGLMDQAFSYVMKKGLTSETAYKYTARDGRCKNPLPDRVIQAGDVSGFVDVKPHSHDDLVNAVGTVGPVSVAVDANDGWQFYSSGIMDWSSSKCPNGDDDLDHGVLAVGYDSTGSKPFWIVKNSWGHGWGEAGYIRLGFGASLNVCGILNDPSYPQFK